MVCVLWLLIREARGRAAGRETEIREGAPCSERFSGDSKSREAAPDVFFMDCLLDKLPGEMRKGAEKGTVIGKGTVCSGINETDERYLDGKRTAIFIEEESAYVQVMSPDMGNRMALVVTELIIQDLFVVFG